MHESTPGGFWLARIGSGRRWAFVGIFVLALVLPIILPLVFAEGWTGSGERGPESQGSRARAVDSHANAARREAVSASSALSQNSPPEISPTSLPIRLRATIIHSNPAHSIATLEDEALDRRQTLKVGEGLIGREDIRVARIERMRILIDHQGQLESVPLEVAPPSFAFEVPEAVKRYRRDLSARIQRLSDRGRQRPRHLKQEGALLRDAEVVLAGTAVEPRGIEFKSVMLGGIYDRIGIRSGDVVTDINGISLASPDGIQAFALDLLSRRSVAVGVERGDGAHEVLDVPDAFLSEAIPALNDASPSRITKAAAELSRSVLRD